MTLKKRLLVILPVFLILIIICAFYFIPNQKEKKANATTKDLQKCEALVTADRQASPSHTLLDKYKNLTVYDFQSLNANHYLRSEDEYAKFHIDRVGLGGWLASRDGILSDELSWEAYKSKPDFFYPYFASFDMREPQGIDTIKQNLDKGYVAVGEIAAASTYSNALKNNEWKAENPLYGNLPQLYTLAAKYDVPVILHVDPPQPYNKVMRLFEMALDQYPDTKFVFDTGNVYNIGDDLETLLKDHKNLYISFYAGFNAYDPASPNKLSEYVKALNDYPDRFLLMSDSGYGITEDQAYQAMYQLIDQLEPKTVCDVSYLNMQALYDHEVPTKYQLSLIKKYDQKLKLHQSRPRTKMDANKLIFSLQDKLGLSSPTYTDVSNLPTADAAERKPMNQLTDQDRVAISRDLLHKVEFGIFSPTSQAASQHFEEFYQSLFENNGMALEDKMSYQQYPYLNKWHYNEFSFSKEIVSKEPDDFIYTTHLLEDMTNVKTHKNWPAHSLYRLYITYDQKAHAYKIKSLMAVPLD